MPSRELLDWLAAMSVNVNGLIVPGRSIQRTLARHSFPLVVDNNDPVWKVSLVGSSTAVKFGGRYLLLCTNHQLKGVDPQQVCMLTDYGSVLVTSGGVRAYSPSPDTDAFDLVAFDFTEPVQAHPELARRFFDLSAFPRSAINGNVVGVLLSGFPSKGQSYELEERNHLGFAQLDVDVPS